jgi:hypothetical protein
MPVSAKKVGDKKVAIGGNLTTEQIQALDSISVGAEDIFDNLDSLNEEIVESGYEVTSQEMKLPTTPAPKASVVAKKKTKQNKSAIRTSLPPERKPKGANMDFDQELDAAAQELETRDIETPEMEDGADIMKTQIMELLSKTPGAPSLQTIEKWKQQLGQNAIHVMGFGKGDVYIFTHLKRGQWKKIQELMTKAQETGATDVEDALKEKVVTYCTLWPKPLPVEFFYNSKAGVVDSLYQVILLNSYFLSPQQAMMLTTQL